MYFSVKKLKVDIFTLSASFRAKRFRSFLSSPPGSEKHQVPQAVFFKNLFVPPAERGGRKL